MTNRKHGASGVALAAFLLAASPALSTNDDYDESSGYGQNDERVVLVYGEVNDEMARNVIGRLRYLARKPDPIEMHINSPGGAVGDGLAIYDVMMSIPNVVRTVCMGQCESMGAFLLATGSPGQRVAYANANIMYHQPSGGEDPGAKATAQAIATTQTLAVKERVEAILASHTGLESEDLADMMKDDANITPRVAKQLGFIDAVLQPAKVPSISRKPVITAEFCDKLGRRRTIAMCRPTRVPQ